MYEFICSIINEKEIIRKDMSALGNYEIDIYIPSKKLGIEYNGSYWHSTLKKKVKYHQNKTIAGAKRGVRIIHIFDYEWHNINKKEKIKSLLKHALIGDSIKIYARDTKVIKVESTELREFLDKYHLQGYTSSSVNLGLQYRDELVGVMTFGVPRFDKENQYELIRMAWKSDTVVVGGTEKLFKHFITEYKPLSIITYSDITKLTGNTYPKLGFKVDCILDPNYVWVNPNNFEVFTRYQTMKHKLVESGLGDESQTEDSIMEGLGFLKVYDCGNLKLSWRI